MEKFAVRSLEDQFCLQIYLGVCLSMLEFILKFEILFLFLNQT